MLTSVQPPAGTPLAVERYDRSVRTDSRGDARLTIPSGEYSYISVEAPYSALEVMPWGSPDQGWQVRAYRSEGCPARWRRVRLVVTTMRAEES